LHSDQDDVEGDAEYPERTTFRLTPPLKEMLGIFALCAMFVASGGVMVNQGLHGESLTPRSSAGETLIIGILTVAVIGTFVVAGGIALVRPSGLSVVRDGVYCFSAFGAVWLPWDAIERVDVEVRVVDQSMRARTLPRPLKIRFIQRRLAFALRHDRDVTLTGLAHLLWSRHSSRGTYHFGVGDLDAHAIRAAIQQRLRR
jgi:hypothetical protein